MKLKGSMVIEAAIIFPMIIIILSALIFFAYYEHDIVVLRSEARTGIMKYVAENIPGEWEFTEERSENLFYLIYEDMKSNKSGGKWTVSADVKFKIFPFVSEYLDKDLTDGKFEEEYKEYLPAQFVRRMGAMESLSDKTTAG